jgi:hypothetical protein
MSELDPQAIEAAARAQFEADLQDRIRESGGRMKRHHYPEWHESGSREDRRLYFELVERVVSAYLANVRNE